MCVIHSFYNLILQPLQKQLSGLLSSSSQFLITSLHDSSNAFASKADSTLVSGSFPALPFLTSVAACACSDANAMFLSIWYWLGSYKVTEYHQEIIKVSAKCLSCASSLEMG